MQFSEKAFQSSLKRVGVSSKDQAIMDLLALNCRLNNSEIGREVRLSKDSVAYHIRKLRENGLMFRNRVFIDYAPLGLTRVDILVKFGDLSSGLKSRLLKCMGSFKYVYWYCFYQGEYDLRLNVIVDDLEKLSFVINRLKGVCGGSIEVLDVLINTYRTKYPQLFRYTVLGKKRYSRGSFQKFFFEERVREKVDFDRKDVLILLELDKDARVSLSELSLKTGVSVNTLYKKIKRLIEKRVILSFAVEPSSKSFGLSNQLTLIEFKSFDEKTRKKLVEYGRSLDFSTALNEFAGRWTFSLEMRFMNTLDFNAFFDHIKRTFEGKIKRICILTYTGEYGHVFNPLKLLL
jgi:DNA-binding Lrp family transcriptional regulator